MTDTPPDPRAAALDRVLGRLELYAAEFERLAKDPAMVLLAAGFRDLVDGLAKAWPPVNDAKH